MSIITLTEKPILSVPHSYTLGDFQDCVSYLMTLKHRDVTLLCESQSIIDPFDKKNIPPDDDGKIPNRIALALPEDKLWLSELHCFLRAQCCEFFRAREVDRKTGVKKIHNSVSSGNRVRLPVSEGRVGIRCQFCGEAPSYERASQAVSFPSQISGIYSAVVMMQCRHFPVCRLIPEDARAKLLGMKRGSITNAAEKMAACNMAGRQQYWIDSAHKLGLVDTSDGIRFAAETTFQTQTDSSMKPTRKVSDLNSDVQVFSTPICLSSNSGEKAVRLTYYDTLEDYNRDRCKLTASAHKPSLVNMPTVNALHGTLSEIKFNHGAIDFADPSTLINLLGDSELVTHEDKDLVPDYLLIAMAQMKPCLLENSDRIGCYKDREIGFKGMSCKHCGGQPGFGKFFPATVRSLAQTTTSQTILKHVAVKCHKSPEHVRHSINQLQEEQVLKDASIRCVDDGKPKYGSRKVFFQRVWARLHGGHIPSLPIKDIERQDRESCLSSKTIKRPLPNYNEFSDHCSDIATLEDESDDEASNVESSPSPKSGCHDSHSDSSNRENFSSLKKHRRKSWKK